ncbi:hypothetical protein [Streptomyces sp. SID5910]|nr:hypothetical protein [Streptomyces sp. SID5910]
MATTGARKVRWYDARHACLSHRTYAHPDPQSLRVGSEKLAELLG